MNLNRIITESINKVLLENAQLWFNQLSNHTSDLDVYRRSIKSNDLSGVQDKQVANFIANDFCNFLASLVQALKRCIQSQNINESLADYGIQMPGELLAAGNDAKRYYRNTIRALTPNYKANQGINNNNNQTQANGNDKLLDLLTNAYPNIQRDFVRYNQNYAITQPIPDAYNAMNTIENYIIPIVKKLRNAQGQNP